VFTLFANTALMDRWFKTICCQVLFYCSSLEGKKDILGVKFQYFLSCFAAIPSYMYMYIATDDHLQWDKHLR